uniref:Uncharacterized protein n=1 Tax=Aegilops tauschii subsp. strangulata TaxID=200361 RepID=A0A453Q5I7_AEGTS
VDAILRTPAGMEMPDVIDLRKSQMKEADNDQAERPLYQVLEQKEERTASAGALYRLNHAYVLVGAQDKPPSSSSSGPKRNQVLERVDITIHLDQLDAVHDTLAAKYRELRGEGESAGKRKRRGKIRGEGSKKMDFKF